MKSTEGLDMSRRIPILFGTESGNAEDCAERLAESLCDAGHESEAIDMMDFTPEDIAHEQLVFIVTSTHGNGGPPANAAGLLSYLKGADLALGSLRYAILGLGDTSFAYFAQCGKDFDAALEKLGAQRVLERIDCDVDFDDDYDRFEELVLEYVAQN